MDGLVRGMLLIAVGLMLYAIIVLCILAGPIGWVVLAAFAVAVIKKKKRLLFGLWDGGMGQQGGVAQAGLAGAKKGLILGRLDATSGRNILARLKAFQDLRLPAKDACEQFLAPVNRHGGGELVRLPHACHSLVLAPTGSGKGVSCVIPFLLTCQESCVVLDYKGELAKITGPIRRRMGDVVTLDPFKIVTQTPDTLNAIDSIRQDSPLAIDDCNALGQALVVRGEEKGEGIHFLDAAEMFISAVTCTVVQYGQPGKDTGALCRRCGRF